MFTFIKFLTSVLMDNFCPCFSEKSEKRFSGLLASGGRDKKEIENRVSA